ncbi:hypothetical protein KP509_10G024200 [Ceratopteris richardii]|uniref:RCK N-terminal domain-containing protein n=1 Tax=Ceratopteris richardii TaxID=49495 RepID=A0A8T2TZY3_CERRI|nr:hypothetical protein KP509_10G024200 [Ceratopteris richardii]KAH7426965.1 hypothetical protein KP509_10G024200 [Ceratopteris richardii]
MSLTPFLNEIGQNIAQTIEAQLDIPQDDTILAEAFKASDPVVIIGFGQMGQVLANFLSTPLASGLGGDSAGWRFVAFDLDPSRVKAARKAGFPVLYGDGSRPAVLQTAGINTPKAVMVMYTGREEAVQAVERLRLTYPGIPIYARAEDLSHLLELKSAGATDAILENTETSLQLGSVLLRGLGVLSDDVSFLTRVMRESLELRARVALEKQEEKDGAWLSTFQMKVRESWDARMAKQRRREPSPPSPKLKLANVVSDLPDLESVSNVVEIPSHSNGSLSEHTAEIENQHMITQVEIIDNVKTEDSLERAGNNMSETYLGNFIIEEEEKVPWFKKMKFSHYDPSSGSLVPITPSDDDSRGVTWCALNTDDNLEEDPQEKEAEQIVQTISNSE